MFNIGQEDNVLVIYNKIEQEGITKFNSEIKSVTKGSVELQDSERITLSSLPVSKYDVVISNPLQPSSVEHTDEVLANIIKILKPSGKLIVKDSNDLTLTLKLNGFINVQKNDDNTTTAQKPTFEVGSKSVLKLSDKAKKWTIDSNEEDPWYSKDDGDDLIEQDLLIDKDDMAKPDKDSLRVCSTTGKRKACADCTCGLAEELRGEQKETPKSSCGSCYLGDAFRCATCPYLGMPAFKPGETVKLDLDSDI